MRLIVDASVVVAYLVADPYTLDEKQQKAALAEGITLQNLSTFVSHEGE
ncbi:MAG: hypothetical protein ACOYL5_09510 [Phototrophicaceae bacterium]|jgi:hypothetical protein